MYMWSWVITRAGVRGLADVNGSIYVRVFLAIHCPPISDHILSLFHRCQEGTIPIEGERNLPPLYGNSNPLGARCYLVACQGGT